MNHDHEALANFMGGYFHEDWPDEGSPDEILQRYFRDHDSTDELSSVLRALRELVDGDDSDDEELSDRLFDEFGCYFYPPGVGLSTRAWLRSVAEIFEREINVRRAV